MAEDVSADVVDFDAEAVLAAAREAVGEDRVLVCVVYDTTDFQTVYVDDRVDALYEDDASREDHFKQIHSFVHLDFTEQELFDELLPQGGDTRAFVTYMADLVAVRVVADRQSAYFSVAPDSPVTDLVDAVERAMER